LREIKFRAWDEGLMEYSSTDVFGLDAGDILQRFDNDNVMQFTGLYDKNGKEIYEGDIVKLVNKDGIKHITEIKWHNGRYVIDTWMMFADTLVLHKCEVIGNIYENPELIEGNDATA
jgi:hypothetical protein